MKKNLIVKCVSGLFLILSICLIGYELYQIKLERDKQAEIRRTKEAETKLINEITEKYNNYVITINNSKLYTLEDNNYKKIGNISPGVILNLEEITINSKTKYFKIVGLDQEYYIKYQDVIKTENIEKDKRYLNYIKFDKNIVTKDRTNFYLDDKIIFTINKSFNLPIYIIDGNKYYVEYGNRLMYVLKDDISSINSNQNSTTTKASKISTIAYHFIYNPDNGDVCNEVICHSTYQIQSHIDHLKNNKYFTLTMKEFEMWIDGKLNLPKKSILITVDDGSMATNASKIFTDNKINASIFVVSSWFDPKVFETEYFEVHSHGNDLHNAGACPGYGSQGGAIQCLAKDKLLADLKTSREKTNMTTAFAYPFYEFNKYSINVLKEAGFTMGFGGLYAGGRYNMTVGADKFRIPRITFLSTTTVNDLQGVLDTN